MKIGVTSQNFRTITGHGGKSRRFMIFEVAQDNSIAMTEKLDLPKDASIHEHSINAPHPIDGLKVLITGSCGEGFRRKMAMRGIKVVTTAETDPLTAVTKLVSGEELLPALPEDDDDCGCSCNR